MKKNILPLRFDLKVMKTLIRCLSLTVLSVAVLVTSCSTSDSWPETVYLDRLFVDGQEVSASPGNQSPFNLVSKSVDEIVNNSTTLQPDDELFVSFTAGKKYEISALLLVRATQVADIKYRFEFSPHTNFAVPWAGYIAYTNTALSGAIKGTTEAYGGWYTEITTSGGNEANTEGITLSIIAAPTIDTTFSLSWAQGTAESSNTTVLAGSFIEYREIE